MLPSFHIVVAAGLAVAMQVMFTVLPSMIETDVSAAPIVTSGVTEITLYYICYIFRYCLH